jgi:deoxyribose-phosphate aldolase
MEPSTRPKTLAVNLDDLAKMIDHSLLHPSLTDAEVVDGLQTSIKYGVATGV